jgi:hypothetical protein
LGTDPVEDAKEIMIEKKQKAEKVSKDKNFLRKTEAMG